MEIKKESKQNLLRKLFCYYFVKLRNVREAGIKAGFSENQAFVEGMKILDNANTIGALNRISEKSFSQNGLVKSGLERLAFGSVNDAVALVFSEEVPSSCEISRLDLFNVSEIKRVKGGGVEVKFFDRQKALEKLWELENTADVNGSAESFFNAIRAGAEATSDGVGGEFVNE